MLKIKGAPFVQKMEPMKVVAGKSMFVTCPVAGWPISSIAWEKGIISEFSIMDPIKCMMLDFNQLENNIQY